MWVSIWMPSTTPSYLSVLFSKDSALMSKEEFSNHVMLITDVLLHKGKWERGHGVNCISYSYLCGSSVCARVPREIAEAAVAPRTQAVVQSVFIGKADVCPR